MSSKNMGHLTLWFKNDALCCVILNNVMCLTYPLEHETHPTTCFKLIYPYGEKIVSLPVRGLFYYLSVLGEKVHLTTHSFCLSTGCQGLKSQDKAEKGATSWFWIFLSCSIALDCFGATLLILTSVMRIKMKVEKRNFIWSLYLSYTGRIGLLR